MESMKSVILVPGVRRLDLLDFDQVMIQEPECFECFEFEWDIRDSHEMTYIIY